MLSRIADFDKLQRAAYDAGQLCNILSGDTMVPNIEEDSILPLGYSIIYIYKE